jgi:hypothetical protein
MINRYWTSLRRNNRNMEKQVGNEVSEKWGKREISYETFVGKPNDEESSSQAEAQI